MFLPDHQAFPEELQESEDFASSAQSTAELNWKRKNCKCIFWIHLGLLLKAVSLLYTFVRRNTGRKVFQTSIWEAWIKFILSWSKTWIKIATVQQTELLLKGQALHDTPKSIRCFYLTSTSKRIRKMQGSRFHAINLRSQNWSWDFHSISD